MKEVYVIRHAKSSWGDLSIPDFDRPLNERGKKDAPEMAKRLIDRKVRIDAFITSPAKRARKTCRFFCEEYGVSDKKVIVIDALYHAPEEVFYQVIADLDDTFKRVAVFSHNPGITDFVNSLNTSVRSDNMPTCAIFGVEADIKKWADFRDAGKKFLLFDYPRLI